MELGDLKDLSGILAFLISVATMFYAWFTSRSRLNTEHLKRVDGRLQKHSAEISRIDNELKHLPAKDDVVDLKLALSKLEGTVGRLDENMSATSRIVHRMEEFLMNNGSK